MGTRRAVFLRSESGSVILETALMLTVILILMFGMVDFGRVMYTSNNLISAAREGARFGAVQNRPGVGGATGVAAIKTVVENRFNQYTFGGDNLLDKNIDIDTGGVAGVGATYVKVSIKYQFKWISPVAGVASVIAHHTVSYTDSLHSQATYRYENQ